MRPIASIAAAHSMLDWIRAGHCSDDWRFEDETGWPVLDATIEVWRKKNIIPGNLFKALDPIMKGESWSLARQWNTLFLDEMFQSLTNAIITGRTVREWAQDAQPIIVKYGGAEAAPALIDGLGEMAPHYADMVYRTNSATFYAAGRYAEMFSRDWMAISPYWMYSAIHDSRTRPAHSALDGLVFAKDDTRGRSLLPPLYYDPYNCRCIAIEMSADDIRAGGYKVTSGVDASNLPLTDDKGRPMLGKDGNPLTVGSAANGQWVDQVSILVPDVLTGNLAGREAVN